MDQSVIALPEGIAAAVGDEVDVFGGDGAGGAPTVVALAEMLGTISYEVVVGIAARVPRVYRHAGAPDEELGNATRLQPTAGGDVSRV